MKPKENADAIEQSFIKVYKAELILFTITFGWGLSFPLSKIALQFISPVFFVALRILITLIVFCLIFRKKISFGKFESWKAGIILGVFLFLGFSFQTIGLIYTSASKSGFITGTSIVIIPFAQYFILRIKPGVENIVGAVIVMAGLYILSEAYFTTPNAGDVLTFLCAIAFAIYPVLLNKYSERADFYNLTYGQFLSMTILSFILMIFMEMVFTRDFFIEIGAGLVILLLYGSLISTLLSIFLVTKYQKETTPLRAGIIYSMEAMFAALFAFIILGEILNLSQIIGALLMIVGLIISEFYGLTKLKFSK